MYRGTTQVLLVHILAGDGLHHLRSGKEHVRGVLHHQGEVGEGGGVDSTAGARTEDSGNLWNHARCEDIALEDLSIASEGVDAFLDTCATRVVDADDGCAHLHTHVHYLADLLCHGLGERATIHGEVLCEDVHQSAINRT